MKLIITALASFGMSGKVFHAPLLNAHPGFNLKTVVERNKFDAKNIYPEIQVVNSFNTLLEDAEIELIIVNTPDQTHSEFATKALRAGKHVVVEKPFTQHTSEGQALLNLSRFQDKLLTVFQNRRWDGDFLTVQKIIKDFQLGQIVEFETRYDRYRNYIQQGSWKESASSGSGTLYNLGSHLIDQALVLFGMPDAVTADIRKIRNNSEVDDFFNLILHYERKHISLKASYLAKEPGPHYTVHGTHGSFVKYGLDPQEEALKNGIIPNTTNWGKDDEKYWGVLNTVKDEVHSRTKIETIPGNYMAFYENLYQAITEKAPLAVKPQEAIRVIEIIEAAIESQEYKRTIEL